MIKRQIGKNRFLIVIFSCLVINLNFPFSNSKFLWSKQKFNLPFSQLK